VATKSKKQIARNSTSKSGVKIHSYYTLPSRGNARPELDRSERGGNKKNNQRSVPSINKSRVLRLFLAVGVVIGILYVARLSANPVLIVNTTPALGRTEAYQQGASEILSLTPLNRTKFTLQRAGFIEKMLEEFPEIESLTISTPMLGSRPVIHIKESRLVFRLESNAKTYVVNDSGVVVGESKDFVLEPRSVAIRDESGVEVTKGARVLRSDDAEFFVRTDALLGAKGRVLQTIRITSVPREAYLVIKDLPYTLRVYLDDSPDTQMASFFSAEKTLGERGERPATYMDLRAGEKVFWQ
jgi:cell division septal protein FtsQ